MKIRVTMKDPDVLHDAVNEAALESARAQGLEGDEAEAIAELRAEKAREVAVRWFRYGEYLDVEIDTEAGTCVVLPAKG